MFQQVLVNLPLIEDAGGDGVGDGHVQREVRLTIPLAEIPGWPLMKLMNGLAQLVAA